MIRGFRDLSGQPHRFEDIDIVRDAAPLFNCSPATLSMLISTNTTGRAGVNFSASMLSKTPRQLLLEASDFYPPTSRLISAWSGTIRHQQINVASDRLIVEQRFHSKHIPGLSGQIDHAAIVELTDDGTLVVDLYDLKTIRWFSVKLCAEDIWKNHPDYAWQLNLCAALMEEHEHIDLIYDSADSLAGRHRHTPQWVTPNRIRVRKMFLECIPPDSSYNNAAEAAKLGFPEWSKVLIEVPRKSADQTYAVYAEAMRVRDETLAAGDAPLCADRWSNRKVADLRCHAYCQVSAECKALSLSRGEYHPLYSTEEALQASLLAAIKSRRAVDNAAPQT